MKEKLQDQLNSSRDDIIKYYLPRVVQSPPDALAGQLLTENPTEADARQWLTSQLHAVFPKAEELILHMELEQSYKT